AYLGLFFFCALIGSLAPLDSSPQPATSNAFLIAMRLILGIVTFIVGFGVLNLRLWAYWLTLIVQILNIIFVVVNALPYLSIGSPSPVPFLLISLAILAYLCFGESRATFTTNKL